MEGRKNDDGKDRHDLIPVSALEQIVKVLNFGAAKYDDHNWTKVPNLDARYYAAAQRHLTAWRKGELVDADSGLPHLAHAGCCILFLLSKQVGFDRSLTENPCIGSSMRSLFEELGEDDELDEIDPDEPIPFRTTGEAWAPLDWLEDTSEEFPDFDCGAV